MRTTLIGLSANAIVAIGMTICLIAGGFDLSVGSILALAGIITTKLFSMDVNIWVSAIVSECWLLLPSDWQMACV